MTTEVRFLRVADPFSANEVLNLTPDGSAIPSMTAAVWLARGTPHEAHARAFRLALPLVHARLSDHALWLLIGHSTPQPDTRWCHAKKLWGSLRSPLPQGTKLEEKLVTGPDGPRYFSAALLDLSESSLVVDLLEEELASCVVALPERSIDVMKDLTARGWAPRRFAPSSDVLSTVCKAGGLVLWPIGAFDDLEGGAALVAKSRAMIDLLVP